MITIEFEEPLEENTTYTMDFQQSVVDITEKNPAEYVKLAFSTGAMIDTLFIAGQVTNLDSGNPVEGAVVTLYDPNDTIKIEEHAPLYFTKTDTAGYFQVSNLKAGEYLAYALYEDKTPNLLYDKIEEQVGFFSEPILLDSSGYDNVNFQLVAYDERELEYKNAVIKKEGVEITFNKTLLEYELDIQDSLYAPLIFHKNEDNLIRLYYTGEENMIDSVAVRVIASDSLYQQVDTTCNIIFSPLEEKKEKKKKEQNAVFKAKVIAPIGKEHTQNAVFDIVLAFEKPIYTFDTESMQITRGEEEFILIDRKIAGQDSVLRIETIIEPEPLDSTSVNLVDSTQVQIDSLQQLPTIDSVEQKVEIKQYLPVELGFNHNQTQFSIKNVTLNEDFKITFNKGAFISVENDTVTEVKKSYTIKDPADYGSIEGLVQTDAPSFIIQLMNDKNEVEAEIKNNELINSEEGSRYKFEYVAPGTKTIRILIDKNLDGKWSKGSFVNNLPPEEIVLYNKELEIKANWELTEENLVF